MEREMTIEASVSNLDDVLAFVDARLEEAGCGMKEQMQIDVAVEEIYVNIAHYAYVPQTCMAKISVDIDTDKRQIVVEFRDSGMEFDPLAKPDPDTTLSAQERQIGGLGIYMVKKSMDDVTYTRSDGQNILTLYKNF
ncbi:MAG: ATP-binding protein [Lachnospiraceae bacterium]|nr:ATP-binding protein [Lachnospiraceae bacterium]